MTGKYACKYVRLGFALAVVLLVPNRSRGSSNLVWHAGAGFRFAEVEVPRSSKSGFTLLPPSETGVTFSNRLAKATVAANRLYEIGSGVALGDVDGDGRVDIYFCALEGDNVLYRNLGGWKFEDISVTAGVSCSNQFSTGCVFADLDGDGDLDLLVNSLGGGTRAFLNDGLGHFAESQETLLARRFGATSLALADVDGDRDLDLYVTNYRGDTFQDFPLGLRVTSRRHPDGSVTIEPADRFATLVTPSGGLEAAEKGEPDFLYINRGGGRFSPARWDVGVFLDEDGRPLAGPTTDWGLAVMFRDLNGDGLPDLYVCNDFVNWPDRIWLNEGGKRFRAAPRYAFRNISLSSMAMDAADINRDGHADIFVADMLNPRREERAWQRPDTLAGTVTWPIADPKFRPEIPRNTLHLARGDGTFAEIAQLAGLSATDWTWSVTFLDVDLDGWEDLLVATGANHDVQDLDALGEILRLGGSKTAEMRLRNLDRLPLRATPSLAFRNGHNLTFEDVSAAWGFNVVGVAHGTALGDLDNDGDLDVVVNCLNAPARIHRNDSPASRLAIRLKGIENTRGIGAKIKVTGGPATQTQEMIAGGRYLSGDDAMRVFAAGTAEQLEVEIIWRNGKRSAVKNAKPNCVYEIDESGAEQVQSSKLKVQSDQPSAASSQLSVVSSGETTATDHGPPLFEDVSTRLNHTHVDSRFDDFARQPMLPRKLSTLGPGLGWADIDDDGDDDLFIGGGKNGRLVVFRNDGKGTFTEWTEAPVPRANSRDQTTLLVMVGSRRVAQLIVGESNWEDADTNAPSFRIFPLDSIASTGLSVNLPSSLSATGPLALADVDGDGDLDLFRGGRVTPGRYPEPAASHVLRNNGDTFSVVQTFPELGLVSGAVLTDLDGDGDPDLALACEWGSIRLFRNNGGNFAEWNPALHWPDLGTLNSQLSTLNSLTGWWNGIATGDFDGDGRLDLAASNWGRNWRTDQKPGLDAPVELFYGDFAENGIVHTLMASNDPWLSKPTPWREKKIVAAAIPAVAERLPSYHAYGKASVQEVLGAKFAAARHLQIRTTDSMVFLNRGDRFEARRLPIQAQFAPAFGVSAADFDGDGHEDLFLAQNFFGVDAETSRHDAGIGLVLLGDGRGGFRALGPNEGGVTIYGEQRGSAVADFDSDGRMDLAVGQQSGATKLFRNVGGKQGVRVKLHGTNQNPRAIGALVRLKLQNGFSATREIHLGGGYWSQDSSTLIFGTPAAPKELHVRWPGGKSQQWTWPEGVKSVEVWSDAGVKPR